MDWGHTNSALMTSGGGSTGVREYIKGRTGLYGNTGEPNVSARKAGNVDEPGGKGIRFCYGQYRLHNKREEKSDIASGNRTEGNRRVGEGRRQS